MLQNWCGVPRIWSPAVICPYCGYPNDAGYAFCQACGQKAYGKVVEKVHSGNIKDTIYKDRVNFLEDMIDSSPYNKKKSGIERELISFLNPLPLSQASPLDICRFLVQKDEKGKTQVHVLECVNLGKSGFQSCGCPRRLAAGTIQSLVGQLKTLFESRGQGNVWNETQNYGNPVASMKVKKYVKAVKREQAMARVKVTQATPLFFDKLKMVFAHIDNSLAKGDQSAGEIFAFLRDQAFFKLQFFGGDRAGDLGKCVAQDVRRLGDNSGLVISRTVGKTLSNGRVNEFAIVRMTDQVICPVAGLERYVEEVAKMGVNVRQGYLFRPLDAGRKKVLDEQVSTSSMYSRLRSYLKTLGLDEGETTHSIRGGCAVTMAVSGYGSSEDIMKHVGWFSEKSLDRYSRMGTITGVSAVGSMLSKVAEAPDRAANIFKRFGDPSALPFAFP